MRYLFICIEDHVVCQVCQGDECYWCDNPTSRYLLGEQMLQFVFAEVRFFFVCVFLMFYRTMSLSRALRFACFEDVDN